MVYFSLITAPLNSSTPGKEENKGRLWLGLEEEDTIEVRTDRKKKGGRRHDRRPALQFLEI
jgi:hypothetical protein